MLWQKTILIALIALIPMGCTTKSLQRSDFSVRHQTIRSIAIVPADVSFSIETVSEKGQRDDVREKNIQKELHLASESRLRRHGYEVKTQLYEQILAPNSDIAFEFEQFKQRYAELPNDARQSGTTGSATPIVEGTLGQQVTAWTAGANADAILLVRYWGIERSTGKAIVESIPGVILAAATGSGYVSKKRGAFLETVLIDAVTGEILWRNTATDQYKTAFKEISLPPRGMLMQSLGQLPAIAGTSLYDASSEIEKSKTQQPTTPENNNKNQ